MLAFLSTADFPGAWWKIVYKSFFFSFMAPEDLTVGHRTSQDLMSAREVKRMLAALSILINFFQSEMTY